MAEARAPEVLRCVQLGAKTACGGTLKSSPPVPTSQVINKMILFSGVWWEEERQWTKAKQKRFKTGL